MERDRTAAAEYARRIKSSAFFREYGLTRERALAGFALPAISQVLRKAPPCPFSVQPYGKTDAENPQVNP
jgi:hypothetical protein